MITDDEGKQYQSMSHYHMGLPINTGEEPSGKDVASRRHVGATEKPADELYVDHDHNVPLGASALVHPETGKMYGLAVDKNIPKNKEYFDHVALHEATELPLMQDYMTQGMGATEAYGEAHKVATQVESQRVRAHAIQKGEDPDEYQEKYKQFWRDGVSAAQQDHTTDRHPDAHTTKYKLDEGEGVRMAMAPRDIDTGKPDSQLGGVPKSGEGGGGRPTNETMPDIFGHTPDRGFLPAVRTEKGVYTGFTNNHSSAYERMIKREPDQDKFDEGYLWSDGKFLTREEMYPKK